MAAMGSISGENATRKRRPHRKSRRGCRNCKLRRVKCDESRPQCQKCSACGILCNFDPDAPDLQMSIQGQQNWKLDDSMGLEVRKGRMGAPLVPFWPPIICADATSSFELDGQCMDRLNRFRTHTVFTLGSAMVNLYETELLKMAFSNPFLMHALIALAAAHDRYLHPPSPPRTRPHTPSSYQHHRSQCAALFARKLSRSITPQDRDPLWATAALMGIIAFSSVEAPSPAESWPLTPSSSSDLDWLRLSEGKMAVWTLTDPLRPGGMFRALSDEYAQLFAPIPAEGMDGIPPALSQLCNLNASSTAENDKYFAAVHTLARLQRLPRQEVTVVRALTFVGHMQGSFKALLRGKDPVALVLLALWYERARGAIWFIERRAEVEGEAICEYLNRYHGGEKGVMEVLPRGRACVT